MANSNTNLDYIQTSQSQKEVVANGFFDAASKAALFGRRWNGSNGLSFALYGGNITVNGVPTSIPNMVLNLTASATNYIEATPAGTVAANVVGFTPGNMPLYSVVAGAATILSYSDVRPTEQLAPGLASITAAASGDYALTYADAHCEILKIGGSPGAAFNVIVPPVVNKWIIVNGTAETLTVAIVAGSGIPIAAGKTAMCYCDGSVVNRLTADI